MNEPSRLAQLIDQIAEAFRTYDQLAFDEEYRTQAGQPLFTGATSDAGEESGHATAP